MRKISLFFFGLGLIGLSGCATMGAGLFKTEQTSIVDLDVNSSPPDADIYINNNLVGRTPAKGLPLMVKYDEYNYGLKVEQVIKEQYILRVSKKGYKDEIMTIPVKNTGDCVALGRCDPAGLTQTAFNFNLVPEEPANVAQENPSSSPNVLPPKGTVAELKLGNIVYNSDKNQRAVMFENTWYREGDTIQVFDPKLMIKSITYRIEEISSSGSVKLINVNSKEDPPLILGIKTNQ